MPIEKARLDGRSLSLEVLAEIAFGRPVDIDTSAVDVMTKTNNLLLEFAAAGKPIYGVTTGLGPRVKQVLAADEIEEFALKTIRGRAHSVGNPLPRAVVRAAMAIRLNTLLIGASGASPRVARHIEACLNADLVPVIGETASTGAADLLWGGSMGLALIGEGAFLGKENSANFAKDLSDAGISPLKLGPRDGLALVSHSSFSAALAALGHYYAHIIWKSAQTAAALTLEGFRGNLSPFTPSLLAMRPQPGQREAAEDLLRRLENSALNEPGAARRLQDPLSLRNIPQVHGSVFAALQVMEDTLLGEINGSSDNPVVLAESRQVLSGGSFLNPYLGVALVGLNHSLVHLAAQINARSSKLLISRFTDLPNGLLSEEADVAGLAPVAKVAEALFAEISHLATPPIVYPSQVGDGVEDTITNIAISGKALTEIVHRLSNLISFEMIVAVQAIRMRNIDESNLASALRPVIRSIEKISPELTSDRSMTNELEILSDLIMNGKFSNL
ncbi:aromatic amino acid lyase [Sneathiella sp.]|uniref:aromatic amino acid lyase n=1 Tax=Sneathiella sp. TaxID=1964365 RepID=UPI003563EA74